MVAKKDSILTVDSFKEMIFFDKILRTEIYRDDGEAKVYY